MRRLRMCAAAVIALAVVAGCGGSSDAETDADAAPETVVAQPAPVFEPAAPGEQVRPGASTPPAVARAIRGPKVVMVAFLLRGAADDDAVREAVGAVRRSAVGGRGVAYFVYDVDAKPTFGDLPEVLGVTETPTVGVIPGQDWRCIGVGIHTGGLRASHRGRVWTSRLREGSRSPTPVAVVPGTMHMVTTDDLNPVCVAHAG